MTKDELLELARDYAKNRHAYRMVSPRIIDEIDLQWAYMAGYTDATPISTSGVRTTKRSPPSSSS